MPASIFDVAYLIPLVPLLVFVAISLFAHRNRALSQQLAICGIAISIGLVLYTLLATVTAIVEGGPIGSSGVTIRWFSLGTHAFPLGIHVDPTSTLMLSTLALIYLLVVIYSTEVMRDDPATGRFFALISLLAASAFGLLVFDNLLLFFVCWEAVDVCAYLLTSFRRERESTVAASLEAFLVTKVSDLCFLLGLALLYAMAGSLTYSEVLSAETLARLAQTGFLGTSFPVAAMVALLLFGGVVGKCAQFPLHVWLPETNAAPAPASALVHTAASMAGAFLLIRTLPLFEAAAESLLMAGLGVTVVTLVGTLTAVLASLVAVAQRDIRHALTFSVVGQLGYVVAALGIGAYVAGILHLVTSMVFNALLLLAAGSVSRGMEHGHQEQPGDEDINLNDMFNMGGLGGQQPATFWMFFFGAMALAGLPIFASGFWSRDPILAQAWAENRAVCWLLAVAAGIAACGVMRQVCLVFFGPPRSLAAENAQESAPAMTMPLLALVVLTLALTVVGIFEQFQLIPDWLGTFIGAESAVTGFASESMLLGIIFSTGGLVLGFLLYIWRPVEAGEMDRLESAMRAVWLGWLYRWMRDRFYVGRLYRQVLARGAVLLAAALDALDGTLDRLVNETARLGRDLPRVGDLFDTCVLGALSDLAGDAGRLLARVADWGDACLDKLVNLAGRAGQRLALVGNVLDLGLDWLVDLAKPAALALVKLGAAMERGLDTITNSVGGGVRAAGLWFRPRTGKVQDHLQLAAFVVLVLVAILTFVFLQI